MAATPQYHYTPEWKVRLGLFAASVSLPAVFLLLAWDHLVSNGILGVISIFMLLGMLITTPLLLMVPLVPKMPAEIIAILNRGGSISLMLHVMSTFFMICTFAYIDISPGVINRFIHLVSSFVLLIFSTVLLVSGALSCLDAAISMKTAPGVSSVIPKLILMVWGLMASMIVIAVIACLI